MYSIYVRVCMYCTIDCIMYYIVWLVANCTVHYVYLYMYICMYMLLALIIKHLVYWSLRGHQIVKNKEIKLYVIMVVQVLCFTSNVCMYVSTIIR